jgi:hypothetical protein
LFDFRKAKIDHHIDLAKQAILRKQAVETTNLQRGLLRQRFAKACTTESKVPAKREDFVSSPKPPGGGFFSVASLLA